MALPAPAAVTPFGARRYNAWNDEVRRRYGGRVQKVSVAAGFTCPNRDGVLGTGGFASSIARVSNVFDQVLPMLLLEGLRRLHYEEPGTDE